MIPVMLSWSGGLQVSSIDDLEQNHMDLHVHVHVGVKMIVLCKNVMKIVIQTLVMHSKRPASYCSFASLSLPIMHLHCIYPSIKYATCVCKSCVMHWVQGAGGTSYM